MNLRITWDLLARYQQNKPSDTALVVWYGDDQRVKVGIDMLDRSVPEKLLSGPVCDLPLLPLNVYSAFPFHVRE